MSDVERRLAEAGLLLPPPLQIPGDHRLPFAVLHRVGSRLLISGHGPQENTSLSSKLRGKVGEHLTMDQGYRAARLTALSILGSLKRELGDLDRVSRWVRVFGMVNSSPTFCEQPAVINGFSDLVLDLYGPSRGAHARSAVGMAQLPFNIAVEIEAEVEVDGA
ncbi:MAG: RidA family protein [Proteobacteria bacterium]|nr:RidA family protein [Pseudomonadota bacterium]